MDLKLSVEKIYAELKSGLLDKNSAFESLVSFIEHDPDVAVRVKCVILLGDIGLDTARVYNFLENLLISDSDSRVRSAAAKVIADRFLNKGLDALKWSLEYDFSPNCSIAIIEALKAQKDVDEGELKSLIIDTFQNLIKKRVLICFYDLSDFFRGRSIEQISFTELIQIFYNFKVIRFLDQKYDMDGKFSLRNGFVSFLVLENIPVGNIRDFEGLEQLIRLEELRIYGTQITEIKGLDTLTNLRELHLPFNCITEISGLENLESLEELDLSGNKITEIKGLENLKNLYILKLGDIDYGSSNQITEIKGLDTLTNLQELHIPFNCITEIKGLERLKNLEMLILNYNQITEIKGLESLPNLWFLSLPHNQITEIKDLDSLTELSTLRLDNNKIKDMKGLERLTNLRKLFIRENQISDIKGLEGLENLKMVDLSCNNITKVKLKNKLLKNKLSLEIFLI